jgi:uncharacterized C2H2 Zn-finger protein
MSQRIVTECDECLALGETRNAVTVVVRALGVEVELDLCDLHVKPLGDMLARFVELGRTPGRPRDVKSTCPRCGKSFATPQALGRHAKTEHGERVSELRQAVPDAPVVEPTAVTCPECGRGFGKPQALAVHRRRTHGVEGASKATASRRRSHEDEAHEGE